MSTAASHPNLDVVNAAYRAMAAGDRDALAALHHDDVVLHVSGSGDHAGDYVGRDAVLQVGRGDGDGPDGVTTAVHDILWSPEHVVVLLQVRFARDGEPLTQNIVQVVHVADGQITEIWEYLWDQQADRRFWSRH